MGNPKKYKECLKKQKSEQIMKRSEETSYRVAMGSIAFFRDQRFITFIRNVLKRPIFFLSPGNRQKLPKII